MNNEDLFKYYFNPRIGLVDAKKFMENLRSNGVNVSKETVNKFYRELPVNQIFKENSSTKENVIRCPYEAVGCLQMDLLDIKKFKQPKANWLFNVIDIYSRYVWSYPIPTKDDSDVLPYLKITLDEIKKQHPNNTITITSDKGSEFKGDVGKLLKERGIKHHVVDPDKRNALKIKSIIERFHKTLWNKIKKWMYGTNQVNFIDSIDDFTFNYNNTIHSTTKMKPVDVFKHHKIPVSDIRELDSITNDFNVGDLVRFRIKNKTFDKKGLVPKYSERAYKIIEVLRDNRYKIDKPNDEDKVFPQRDLIKATEGEFENVVQEMKKIKKDEKFKRDITKEGIGQVRSEKKEHSVEFYPDILSKEKRVVDINAPRQLRQRTKKVNYLD
jgi:hypothetical protein